VLINDSLYFCGILTTKVDTINKKIENSLFKMSIDWNSTIEFLFL
jgi:hypothetical protein